jgi:hypothetical protein
MLVGQRCATWLLVVGALSCVPTIVVAQHWIPMPPPLDMSGDEGHWWLDSDSIVPRGRYTFFIFTRSAQTGVPPVHVGGVGRTVINCANGTTMREGICTGSCPPKPEFPQNWLRSLQYPRDSALFMVVCGSNVKYPHVHP